MAAAGWMARLAVPAVLADRAMARASAHLGANFYEMAEDALDEALARRPGNAYAHYLAGTALEKTAMFDWTGHTLDKAMEHYQAARRLGLNDELLYAHLAMTLERKGQVARAIEYGETAAGIYPESGDHLSNLAFWYATRRVRLDRALELASRAVEGVPRHPLYHWTRGLVLEALGRYGEALVELEMTGPLLPNVQNPGAYTADLAADTARVRRRAGAHPWRPRPAAPAGTSLQTF